MFGCQQGNEGQKLEEEEEEIWYSMLEKLRSGKKHHSPIHPSVSQFLSCAVVDSSEAGVCSQAHMRILWQLI